MERDYKELDGGFQDLLVSDEKGAVSVLVAEDNLLNQKLIDLQLKKLGYKAEIVDNGREALESVLSGGSYKIILMDCQMPEMDGFEATRAIRQAESEIGCDIPIIAMTAYAMQGDREQCLYAGMGDYLSKPVRLERLMELLKYWIGK